VSLCFHCKCSRYELQGYQRQTADQPTKNKGTLSQLSVAPVEPPCLETTHLQQDNQCTYTVILGLFLTIVLQWKTCKYCIFWVRVLVLHIQHAMRICRSHLCPIWLFSIISQKARLSNKKGI